MQLKLISIFTGTDLNLIHTNSSQNSSQNSSENSSKNSSENSSQNSSSNEFLVSPVAYSYMYIQWEANETISHELIRNIGLTFATIAIVSLVLIMNLQVSIIFKPRIRFRVSVQGVVSLGSHFATLCREFDFYEVKKNIIIFQKENGNTFTLLIIFIVKSLQKEQNSTNLLL